MARDSKEIAQFCLLLTHKPYLPLLPSCRASLPLGSYLLRLPRMDGQAELTTEADDQSSLHYVAVLTGAMWGH